MASQPWIRCLRQSPNRHRAPFNGAMASQPWIQGLPSAYAPPAPPFNGAMASQPWIHRYSANSDEALSSPSMEPWPLSHGYTKAPLLRTLLIAAFNGAMASQPWIPGGSGKGTLMRLVPSMEPWPLSHGYAAVCRQLRGQDSLQWSHGLSAMDTKVKLVYEAFAPIFQWSHGLSAMDTGSRKERFDGGNRPSMEPWPLSHGYEMASSCSPTPSHSPFNGAMASQPWIRGR